MITRQEISTINYIVVCINDFAERFGLDTKAAYCFLAQYGGIDFLMQHYDIEHTLSLDDAVEDLATICRQNGGILQ
jgi:hypothetical protein